MKGMYIIVQTQILAWKHHGHSSPHQVAVFDAATRERGGALWPQHAARGELLMMAPIGTAPCEAIQLVAKEEVEVGE